MGEPIELYAPPAGCPYSESARDDLEWRGVDFVEYDVETYERMLDFTGGSRTVPMLSRPAPTTCCLP